MDQLTLQWNTIKLNIVTALTTYGLKIVISIILLFVGLKVIKYAMKMLEKFFTKSKVDISLTRFLISATRLVLKALLIVMVIQNLGVETAPLLAIIGATGIGLGMALQGSLGNLTGGILILLLRPFKVGDFIEEQAHGHEGIVEDIQVFYTTLKTRDNKVITIPNGGLSNDSIINHSTMHMRRVDLTFGVAYEADTYEVKRVIRQVIDQHPMVMKDKEPYINIVEHGDSSVNFAVLVWCKTEDYLTVKFDLIEQMKIAFDNENISIPYPHMDVNIINPENLQSQPKDM